MALEIKKTTDLKTGKIHICLYGASGTGKTYSVSTLKGKTLVIDVDKGLLTLRNFDNIDYITVNDFKELGKVLKTLKDGGFKEYDNIVLDSMSRVGDFLKKHLEESGFKGFDLWREYEKYIKGVISVFQGSQEFNSVTIYEMVLKEDANGIMNKTFGVDGSMRSRVPHFYDFVLAAVVKTVKDEVVFKLQTISKNGYTCKTRADLETFIDTDLNDIINKLRS